MVLVAAVTVGEAIASGVAMVDREDAHVAAERLAAVEAGRPEAEVFTELGL